MNWVRSFPELKSFASTMRLYSRWQHRQPKRIIMPDGEVIKPETNVASASEKYVSPLKLSTDDGIKKTKRYSADKRHRTIDKEDFIQPTYIGGVGNSTSHKKKQVEEEKMVENSKLSTLYKKTQNNEEKQEKSKPEAKLFAVDETGNYISTKLHENTKKIGSLMLTVRSKVLREKQKVILLEGKRLIRDALMCGCQVETILFTNFELLDHVKDFLPKTGIKLYKITYKDMQFWSDLTTCPGIMGIFKRPDQVKIAETVDCSLPLTIVCDNIRDPGNLGAILRTASGIGCSKILLTKGCVDVWDTKVLRSAAGAHFRVPIVSGLSWSHMEEHVNGNILVADNRKQTNSDDVQESQETVEESSGILQQKTFYKVNYNGSFTLIIGGETEGVSPEAIDFAQSKNGLRVNIPLTNNVDSLNSGAALGIIGYEIKRQLDLLSHC